MKRASLLMAAAIISTQLRAAKVKEIRIEGNARTSVEMSRNLLDVKEGDDVDAAALDRNLKKLYASNFFSDVKLSESNGVLTVTVAEAAAVNNVLIEGNEAVREEELKPRMATRAHSIFSEANVRRDVETIKAAYKTQGYFKAKVDAKAVILSDNRRDVAFEIKEGPQAHVRGVEFIGNENFSDASLVDVILSKPYYWWRFWEMFDTYHEERISYDAEQLRNFYLMSGFLDFEIQGFGARMDKTESFFHVWFRMKEGQRYKVGAVDVKSAIDDLDAAPLRSSMMLEPGDWYNEAIATKAVQAMTAELGEKGFAFVQIEIAKNKHPETGIVDVTYSVKPARRAFISSIDIRNNTRTYDKVIRRNLNFDEQDVFSTSQAESSKQKLMALGFFNTVAITPRQIPNVPDKISIDVAVDEKATGEISFGAGWSTFNKGFLELGVRENNFMGKGQTLGATATFSQKNNNFNLTFVEPYLFDRDLMGGVDAYYNQARYRSTYGYNVDSVGVSPKLGWSYNDKLSHRMRLTIRHDEIIDIMDGSRAALFLTDTSTNLFRADNTLAWRDQIVDYANDTRTGYTISMNNGYAGFGGDKNYVKNDLAARQYFGLFGGSWQLKITAEAGWINPLGGAALTSSDRYILGADSLRGFEYGGVGARSMLFKSYTYGGNSKLNGTVQLNFPVFIPRKYKVSGYAFYDWGRLGRPDLASFALVDYDDTFRTSWGYGIAWGSPIGNISFSWATPIKYQPYDQRQRFLFSIGQPF